jgi:hypothetical protein
VPAAQEFDVQLPAPVVWTELTHDVPVAQTPVPHVPVLAAVLVSTHVLPAAQGTLQSPAPDVDVSAHAWPAGQVPAGRVPLPDESVTKLQVVPAAHDPLPVQLVVALLVEVSVHDVVAAQFA